MEKIFFLIRVIIGFSVGLSTTQGAGFGDLYPYFSFTYGDGGGIPEDVYNITGQQTSPDGQSVRLFGDLGPIDGGRFLDNGFVIDWGGSFEGPVNPGDKFLADLTFKVNATGGTLAWSFYANIWSGENAQIFTGLMPMPASGQVSNAHFESSPFTQPADSDFFEGYLHIDWTGFSPTDTFSISIPQNSIDITYVPVPEPSVLTFAIMALAFALVLRFNRGAVGCARRSLGLGRQPDDELAQQIVRLCEISRRD